MIVCRLCSLEIYACDKQYKKLILSKNYRNKLTQYIHAIFTHALVRVCCLLVALRFSLHQVHSRGLLKMQSPIFFEYMQKHMKCDASIASFKGNTIPACCLLLLWFFE